MIFIETADFQWSPDKLQRILKKTNRKIEHKKQMNSFVYLCQATYIIGYVHIQIEEKKLFLILLSVDLQ